MKKSTFAICASLFVAPTVSAETATYDTTTNLYTVPFVRLNNTIFTDVVMSCDPNKGYTCVLKGAESQICTRGTYKISNTREEDVYSIRTSISQEGIQSGGIQNGGDNPTDAFNFVASWISSPKEQNPYLRNQDLSLFEDNQAYGVMGDVNSSWFSGFTQGDLIHVTIDSTGYIVQQINNGQTAVFDRVKDFSNSKECASISGNYRQDDSKTISIADIVDTSTGTINSNSFIAKWGDQPKFMERYNKVILTDINNSDYTSLDTVIMTDVGGAIAITGFSSETGRVKTTNVFIGLNN